ncbi:MAG: hypothetical protein WCP46_00465 [Alphaproteobacteria bacterium]
MSLKDTYLGEMGIHKHKVRDFLFSKMPKYTNIVGLGGPDIQECLDNYKIKGYKNIEVWERDSKTLLLQLSKIKGHGIKLMFGDILKATPDLPNTIYDLDYCCTIKFMTEHLIKFKNNFMMTFSLRAGTSFTLGKFFKDRDESIIEIKDVNEPVLHTIFKTAKGTYIYTPYFDTSAMCCIAKIK